MLTESKQCLSDFSYEELDFLLEWGEKRFRIDQLYRAVMQNKDIDAITNIPKVLLAKISDRFFFKSVEIVEALCGKDGTEKYLYGLNDGNIIEGVFMPHSYGNTLCVSTQVGCRMGCAFCASGLDGLVRNLSAGEILGQVLAANARHGGTIEARKVTNIVLMGSGEPLDNFENVVKFLSLVSDSRGIGISPRNISLSTCGIVPRIKELADLKIPVVLTISLHSADDEKRSALMPVNKKYPIRELIKAARYYFEKTKRRVIFEYSLIEGENSGEKAAKELAYLLKGLPCHVNLINLNPVKEKHLRGVTNQTVKAFMATLDEHSISNSLRHSMGNDIQGACGQLRNKYVNRPR